MSKGNKYNIVCPKCNEVLYTDDIDFNFKGNEDLYLRCPICELTAIAYIRYGKVWNVEYEEAPAEYGYDDVIQ